MIPRTVFSNCRPNHWILYYIMSKINKNPSDLRFWIKHATILKPLKSCTSCIPSISRCPLQIIHLTGKVSPRFTRSSPWVISSSLQYGDCNSQDDMEQSEISGTRGWPFHKTEIFCLSAVGDCLAAVGFLRF